MNNYDYPEGADNSQAPWNQNQEDNKPIQVNVTVSETLSRTIPITITDYKRTVDVDEDGCVGEECNFDNVNFKNEYYHQNHSIENILSGIYGFLVYLNNKYHFKPSDLETSQRIIEACKGWNEDESEVIYE